MIENKEQKNAGEKLDDLEDPKTDDMAETIDFRNLEPDEDDVADDVIDISDLEADAPETAEEDVVDLTEISAMSMVEGDSVLELTESFREEEFEQESAALGDVYKDILELDETVDDDSFFDLEGESESETIMELTAEEFDIDEEEFDIDEETLAIDDADELPQHDAGDSGMEAYGSEDALEEELLDKLDDYFGEEEDDFDAGEAQAAMKATEGRTGQIDLQVTPLEAALDRVLEKKFGKKIDKMLSDAVSRKVAKEIDALKSILFDSIRNRK